MAKVELAYILATVSCDARKTKYDICVYNGEIWEKFGKKVGMKNLVESVAGCAGATLKEGRVSFRATYIVSKGWELPTNIKPDAVIEYSNHWPYDFCYLYKL